MLARRPAAAAWRDGDRVVEKVGRGDLLPAVVPPRAVGAVRRPRA